MLTYPDSIDLQDQNAPSAKDHTRQPTHPAPLGVGPPAPHQAEALREVAAEAAEQNQRSPRVSKEWSNGDIQPVAQHGNDESAAAVTSKLTGANLQQQDDLAVAQNGGLTGSTAEDAEMADTEGDDGLEDDMMDKISSSPSIDDGGYFLPNVWPKRSDSLSRSMTTARSSPLSQACSEVSSPYVETPEYFPSRLQPEPSDKDEVQDGQSTKRHHHLLGEYVGGTPDSGSNYDDELGDMPSPFPNDVVERCIQNYEEDFDLNNISEEILAEHLDLLNQDSDDQEGIGSEVEFDGIITIPYESSEDGEDDDTFDIPSVADSRFVDSGWGGECLQESEDIDFEFVYALHTFVATVEGQANATKGDTMVLLDDSNSYWWLVRVVKDSSIGEKQFKMAQTNDLLITLVGYLPAEHIETPTERLARLNKHRNIDVRLQLQLQLLYLTSRLAHLCHAWRSS